MATTAESTTCLLRLPQVKQRTGLSRSTIYARIQCGEFPCPINLGGRAVAWIESEVTDWVESRIRFSRSAAPLGKSLP
jgi:prophage regulatory protein